MAFGVHIPYICILYIRYKTIWFPCEGSSNQLQFDFNTIYLDWFVPSVRMTEVCYTHSLSFVYATKKDDFLLKILAVDFF